MIRPIGFVLTFALCTAGPVFAATYTYDFTVKQWCGEADNNGKPNVTDAAIALDAAVNDTLTGSACKMDTTDGDLPETFIRATPHSGGSFGNDSAHGVRFEIKDDCGGGNVVNSEAAGAITATDANMILNLAVGLDYTDGNDCRIEVIDDCPQSGQSGYGAAGEYCVLDLDNPVASPGEDGEATCTFTRKTLDVCNGFDGTSEATCESTTNDRNQYCTWTQQTHICRGSNPTLRECINHQISAGIDIP